MMKFILEDEFFANLPEVTTTKILGSSGEFHKNGLFSSTIFGSEIARCLCGRLEGNFFKDTLCDKCNTMATTQQDTGAKMCIPDNVYIAFINPTIVRIIQYETKINIFELINPQNKKIDMDGHTIVSEDNPKEAISFDMLYNDYENALDLLFKDVSFKNEEFRAFLYANKDLVLNKSIFIIPVRLREAQMHGFKESENSHVVTLDGINGFYMSALTHINNIKSFSETIITTSNLEIEVYELQKTMMELSEFIIDEVIGGKKGLLRNNILSNRICFSGRAPITLRESFEDSNCVTLPREMFIEMYILRIINYLVKNHNMTIFSANNHLLYNRFNPDDLLINGAIKFIIDNEEPIVVINRNPTLRVENMTALVVDSVHNYSTIRIAKPVLPPLAADIDGDTCAVFSVTTEEAKEEVKLLMLNNQILCKYTGGISDFLMPYQDNTLGLHLLEQDLIKQGES